MQLLFTLKDAIMKSIQFADKKTGEEISIAYSDYGKGQPVVLIHGWPSSREMWEYQLQAIVDAGYRVIKYDRRGFGKSSKPWSGYDYDSLAGDLYELMEQLDLKNALLVGFSMGGGEVVRYIANYGQQRIARIALVSSIIPYMLKTGNNPEGVDQQVFVEMAESIKKDRIDFLEDFGKNFFGVGFLNKPVSNAYLDYFRDLATKATQQSTLDCAVSFSSTDFRDDLKKITVPTLIVHGDSDKIVPFEVSSKRTAILLPQAELVVFPDAPHGLFYTHRELLNQHLVNFFNGKKYMPPVMEPAMASPF
jgi:pimeloyl-ACP methyl ester carboxylesterase